MSVGAGASQRDCGAEVPWEGRMEGIDLVVGLCSVFIHVAFPVLLFFFVFGHRPAIFSIFWHSVINYLPHLPVFIVYIDRKRLCCSYHCSLCSYMA